MKTSAITAFWSGVMVAVAILAFSSWNFDFWFPGVANGARPGYPHVHSCLGLAVQVE